MFFIHILSFLINVNKIYTIMNTTVSALKFVFLGFMVSLAFSLSAQVTTTPYFCGFEDTTENSQWILNVGPNGQNAVNKWYIGTGEKNSGVNGLYISSDNGVTPSYSNNQVANVCYRAFTLSAGATYDLAFVWRALGEASADGFYVCWMPASVTTNSSAVGLPNWVNTYALTLNSNKLLRGSSTWTNVVTQIQAPATGAPYKLVFVWNNNAAINNNPGACIDNIQIAPTSCAKPINFTCTSPDGISAVLSWSGTAMSYDIMYRAYGNTAEYYVYGIVGNTVTINNLPEGLYDFWIRSNCDSIHSSIWVSFNNKLLYSPAAHCIDYLNLDGAICTTGTYSNPDTQIGKVDNGPDQRSSRHTVHFTPNETDPRTLNRLKTIPSGEIASVRLGNWNDGAEEESIIYTYTVPATDMPIILLKYAIVLEEPGHAEPPRFEIKITNALGQVIDATCGGANLSTEDAAAEGWNSVPPVGEFGEIWYKDWTVMGMNMTPYAGQTVRIQLSTYDCNWSGHFGCAYFTLNCVDAAISGLSCGSVQTTSISAPDGFNYEWYNASNPTVVVSTDKDLDIPLNDTSTYYCDVIFVEKPQCRFRLFASVAPRAPLSRFSPQWAPSGCRNYVNFRNTSVVTTDKGATAEKCETFYWDFGDGRTSTQESPTLEFPAQGGTYRVALACGLSNDMCLDTSYVDLVVPPIGVTTDTVVKRLCKGTSFIMNGVKYTQTGFYTIPLKSRAGCDSIVNLDIAFLNKIEAEVYDTICDGEAYAFNGQSFTKSGTYYGTVPSSMGCDSVTTLHLTKLNPITYTVNLTDPDNGPNSGVVDLVGLDSSCTYYLNGVESAPLDSLPAGDYVLRVVNEYGCEAAPYLFSLTVSCLDVDLSPIAEICGDDNSFFIPYVIKDGKADSYSLQFTSDAISQGFQEVIDRPLQPDNIEVTLPSLPRPATYTMNIVFRDINCGVLEKPLSFTILYPSSVVSQKWNDVLAVLNSKYNGGYEFSAYQWVKNGTPIIEETGSYLYLGNGVFDLNDEYRVILTRADDAISILSCPVFPELRNDVSVRPTLVTPRSLMRVYGLNESGTAIFWDLIGRKVSQETFDQTTGEFLAPAGIGVFVLEITTANDRKVFKVVVEN